MAKLSIIVPLYNHENEVEACIDSLLRAIDDNVEIVIIDDGSTDNSYKVVSDRYKDNRQIRILQKENGGLSNTRNYGMENIESSYFTFCDPDDTVDTNYNYGDLIKEMESKDLDYLIFNFNIEYKREEKIALNNRFPSGEFVLQNKDEIEGLRAATLVGSINNMGIPYFDGGQYTWSKIYKLSITRENNLFFREDMTYAEDSIFNYLYLEHVNRAMITNRPIYNYAVYDSNMTNRYKKDIVETYDIYREQIRFLENDERKMFRDVYYARIFRNLINVLRFHVFHKDNDDGIKSVQEILKKYTYYDKAIRSLEYKCVSKRQQILLFLLKRKLYLLLKPAFHFSN